MSLFVFDSESNLIYQKEIRQRLDRKEKEIMQNLDKMLEDSVKELDAHTKQIKNKTFTINSSFEVLQNYFASKDEVIIIGVEH